MYIHREGRKGILLGLVIVLAITISMCLTVEHLGFFHYLLLVICWGLLFWFTRFFRIPNRIFSEEEDCLIAPADGTICAIEEVFEKEYMNSDCIQVSIFMSGNDVHVNRYPIDGVVDYVNYHKGNYFVASYPKSSTLNERSAVGIKLNNGQKILIRQVAGVMARRIVCYAHEGDKVKQNQEMGFIKFGSRVDLFLSKDMEICVEMQDVVRNAVSPIARINR